MRDLVKTVGDGSSGGLVDDTEDDKTRDRARVSHRELQFRIFDSSKFTTIDSYREPSVTATT